jgi:ribonucleoside-triphosphate reductase
MSITKVKKRNGAIVDFDISKIERAIFLAAKAVGGDNEKESEKLAEKVKKELSKKFEDSVPTIEDIQELVETVLIESGHASTAKAYIRYREKRGMVRNEKDVVVEVDKTISEYLNKLDWRINANSNQGYSLGGLILNTAGKVTANYWLSCIYPKEIGDAHRTADFHIHDLDMFSGYCAGWSLRALLEEGFNGVSDKIESNAPKHLSSAVAQIINFLGTLQNEWAGAQAFSSFDTYMAPYVKKYEIETRQKMEDSKITFSSEAEKNKFINSEVEDYVYQNIQSFVFNSNIPSRWGTQTPFTNITLDWTVPEDLKDKRLKLGGEYFEYMFGELKNEMDIINRAFIKVMLKGDSKGRIFTFPIPTYNITSDFDWDTENANLLFEMTAKYGVPYFQNFINSDLNPSDVRSMCCRLQLDLKELRKRGGGLFGSAEMTGSIGVVTINSARIGYAYKGDEEGFLKRLDYLMEIAKSSLEIKRKEIQKWIDRGLFPYTKRYLGRLKNHFSTIGINGLNESVRNFYSDNHNIATKEGKDFAERVLDHMREKLINFQEETGNLYNLEATPAEGATYRFAKEDQKKYPGILQAGTKEAPFYTNSSQLPVGFTDDIFEALENQESLQRKYTGGTVLHLYTGERMSSDTCKVLVRKVLEKHRIPYITITPIFSICPIHGYIAGEHDFCPLCDRELGITADSDLDEEFRKTYRDDESYK